MTEKIILLSCCPYKHKLWDEVNNVYQDVQLFAVLNWLLHVLVCASAITHVSRPGLG